MAAMTKMSVFLLVWLVAHTNACQPNGDCGALYDEGKCRLSCHEGDRCYWKFQQGECVAGGDHHDCDHICESHGSDDCTSSPEGCRCVFDSGEGKCIQYSTLLRSMHQDSFAEGLEKGEAEGFTKMAQFYCENNFKNDLTGCSANINCCTSETGCVATLSGNCASGNVMLKKPRVTVACGAITLKENCKGQISATVSCRWDYWNNRCKATDINDQEEYCPTLQESECVSSQVFCCYSQEKNCVKPDREDCFGFQIPPTWVNTVWDCEYQARDKCAGKNDVERNMCKLGMNGECNSGETMGPPSDENEIENEAEEIESENEAGEIESENEAGEIESETGETESEAGEAESEAGEIESESNENEAERTEEAAEDMAERTEDAQEAAQEAGEVGMLSKRHTVSNCESEDLFEQQPCEAAGCAWDLAQNLCYPKLILSTYKSRCSPLGKSLCHAEGGHACAWNDLLELCDYVGDMTLKKPNESQSKGSPEPADDLPLWALYILAGSFVLFASICIISRCASKPEHDHPFLPNENSQYDLVLEESGHNPLMV